MKPVLPYCENCKFSAAAGGLKIECRRYPPSVNPNYFASGSFPIVSVASWCGEYQQKKEGRS